MAMSDPFQTTYEGTMQAKESLGQGIQSVAGSVADVIKKKNQQAQTQKLLQTLGFAQQSGALKDVPVDPKDWNSQVEQMAKSKGISLTATGDDATKMSRYKQLLDSIGIKTPPTTKKELDVDAMNNAQNIGWSYSPSTGDITIHGKEEDPLANEMKQQRIDKQKSKDDDINQAANAIQNGDQLADFSGLYGMAGPVRAELERRGVDVNKLQLQTLAEKKLAQTLNGPQQVRLRQSISSVQDGLDVLDNLNQEFKRSGIKAFNKAQIEALANGSGTKEQQELAQEFKTQIVGLQDEFGNVIMSGNSPTDRALELSGKVFGEDYNDTSISAAIKQMKVLLNTRSNAIDSVRVAGNYGSNPATQTLNATPGMGGNSQQSQQQSKYTLVQ